MRYDLPAKIEAINIANAHANALSTILSAYFAPYVGKQIYRADGLLLKKIAYNLPNLDAPRINVYRNLGCVGLVYVVKSCVDIESAGHCLYHETQLYVGDTYGQVLTNLNTYIIMKTDYHLDDICALGEVYKQACRAKDEAQSALGNFWEYF